MEAVARANASHGFSSRIFAPALCNRLASRVYNGQVPLQIACNLKPLLRRNSGLLEGADAAARKGFESGLPGGREIGGVAYHGRLVFGVRQAYCAVPSIFFHGKRSAMKAACLEVNERFCHPLPR